MSTNQPPQQGPVPGGQWSAPVPERPAPRGRRRGVTIGVVGVAAAALVAGAGVFAWAKLSGGGPQPADALPSDAAAYVRLDLDPSAEQKLNAMSLLHKWPQFEEATGISEDDVDLRKLFVDRAISTDECDVDYEDDIEPWIGDRLGFAIVPGDDAPQPVLAVQVKDEDEAESGARKLAECAGGSMGSSAMSGSVTESAYGTSVPMAATSQDTKVGVAFTGDYMLLAQDQDLADQFASDAEHKSLASNETFTDDLDALGDQGIASAWYDGDSFVDLAEQMGMPQADLDSLKGQDLGSGAAALRAGDDYLELASASTGEVGRGGETSDVDELPESTIAAVSISNGKEIVDKVGSQFETMSQAAPQAGMMLDRLESRTGLSLPDDIGTLLGDQALLAIDSEGMDTSPQRLSDVNAGARLTGDPEEIQTVLDKLSVAGGPAFSQLVTDRTDDGVVLATNEDYASTLTDGGGGLGDTDTFQKAVPDADGATDVVYVDFDRIASLADEMGEDVGPVEPIQAFGMSTSSDDGRAHATMRLTFD